MRELNLLETGCLAGLVLLSLILPLMLSGRLPRRECARRACFWTVGPGQALLGLAAAWILLSPEVAPFALAFGVGSCAMSAVALQRQLQGRSLGTTD